MTLLSDTQRDAVFTAVIEAAETAVLPRFQNLADNEIGSKTSPSDLVTIADREAELLLTKSLTAILPGSVVVGEEAVSENQNVLKAINEDAPVWIVDPVDGTRNFANGQTPFCVMVALAQRGTTQAAWIWRPIDSEMIVAFRDEGVRLFETNTGFDRPLQVSRPMTPTDMNGFVSFKYLSEENRLAAKKNAKKMRRIQAIGCAGEEYLRIAEGRDHFAVFGSLNPWDHAPGSLIVEEAGGLAVIGGESYSPVHRQGPLWVASSAHVFETARTRLFEA